MTDDLSKKLGKQPPEVVVFTPSAGKSCVTAQCHEDMGKAKYVHGPVAVGECIKCHIPEDPKEMYNVKKHSFTLAGGEEGICYLCHERKDV